MTALAARRTSFTARPAPSAARAERRRQLIVRLVLLLYVLSLVEGTLRKWFLPGLATPLYFMRDPVLWVVYAYSLQHGFMLRGNLARIWLSFALVTTAVGLIPFMVHGIDLRAWILGARSYWIYLPLAFVVANTFRREDLERFVRWNVAFAVPYVLLVIYQYQSSPFAWINKGIEADSVGEEVGPGIVRPYGVFTYTGQHVGFTAFLVANYVAYLFVPRQGRLDRVLVVVGAPAVGSLAVLTGSRSIYFLVAAILGVTLVGSTLTRPSRATMKRNGLVLVSVVVAALLFTSTYGDMYQAMEARFERAAQNEGSIWKRALGGVFSFSGPMAADAPLFGHGIGTGTPALSRFLDAQNLRYGEGDLARSTTELGFFLGLFFIALRWFTAGLVVWLAYRAASRRYAATLPLAGYAMVPISMGQITHSPLNAFVPWLVVGFVLATESKKFMTQQQFVPTRRPRQQ